MEIRLTQGTVVTRRIVFSVVVAKVCASGLPVDEELLLLGPILDPVKSHVDFLQVFLLDGVVGKTLSCGVIRTDGGDRLRIDKLCESGADGYRFLPVD